jgi:HSP20 family protein
MRAHKRSSFFPGFDRMMREMEREMAKMMRDIEGKMPDSMTREFRAPDDSTRREYGPFVYGYSVNIGPDGKPIIREFGNMKPGLESDEFKPLGFQDKREPLVDVIEDNDSLKIVAELPGVEKEDIKLYATSKGLTISVDTAERQYYKELEFEDEVDRFTAKSSYKNGVLEADFKKIHEEKGTEINID